MHIAREPECTGFTHQRLRASRERGLWGGRSEHSEASLSGDKPETIIKPTCALEGLAPRSTALPGPRSPEVHTVYAAVFHTGQNPDSKSRTL